MAQTQTADFFHNQEKAIKKTGLLVILFFIAVVLIIVTLHIVVTTAIMIQFGGAAAQKNPLSFFLNPKILAVVSGSVILIIGGGTLFKIFELRQGGGVVARLLGGSSVSPDTKDPDQRKLLNIVEEMSIASGCPMPEVYILPRENSINAFAAGFTQNDAAIGVTAGGIKLLSRDELQGVIAHEFSHIVNGDMRLNIKLTGVLHGLLHISIIGGALMRAGAYGAVGSSYSSRRGRDRDGGALFLIVLGFAIFAVGAIGLFFGRLIKSAVSRQREFLADASAIQYTRYPKGIAGALKKIGGLDVGSFIRNDHAEEISHFFFGDALSHGLASMFGDMLSTHPKLTDRIRAIDPSFDGDYPVIDGLSADLNASHYQLDTKPSRKRSAFEKPAVSKPKSVPLPLGEGRSILPPGVGDHSPPGASSGNAPPLAQPVLAAGLINEIGRITPERIGFAKKLLDGIPAEIREATRGKNSARALVYALFLGEDEEFQRTGLHELRRRLSKQAESSIDKLLPLLSGIDLRARLPLLDICLPALRQLNTKEGENFIRMVDHLIHLDGKTTLFELAAGKLLRKALDPKERLKGRKGAQYYSMGPVVGDFQMVLSSLAHCGTERSQVAKEAFIKGTTHLGEEAKGWKLLQVEQCQIQNINRSLDRLEESAPEIKRKLLKSATEVVTMDGKLTVAEAELLRALAESLDCPMPPIHLD